MKNICIFTNTLCSGGAEKQAVLLAKVLSSRYSVWLVVYYSEQAEQKFLNIIRENNIQVVYFSGPHFKKMYSLYHFLKRKKINIIFSYLLTTNLIAGTIGRLSGVKFIYTGIRNANLGKRKEIVQKFIQNTLSTKTIYNNYKGLELLLIKGFNPKKAVVIPNCFELNNDVIIRKKKQQLIILSLGRFVEQKDWITSLESIKLLRVKFANFRYYIVGYGRLERQIREWIVSNNTSKYITMIINPSNINKYYQQADIYLQTSLFEGLSNTVMEAMSFSLPLVTTNVGDNNRLVINEKNGYLCEKGDIKGIFEKLLSLCSSREKRVKLGLESYKFLSKNYTTDVFISNYSQLIEGLFNEKD